MVNLANPPVRRADSTGPLKDQLVSLRIEVKSAEGEFDGAELNREIAELAIAEYEQGTFVVDKAALKAERLLADSDVKRKRDQVELAKDQLARVKSSSMNVPADRARESRAADFLAEQEIDLRRPELVLASVESKITTIEDYTKPKRLKELRSRVEKARAKELAQQAEWELGQTRSKSLEAAIIAGQPSASAPALGTQDRKTRDTLVLAIAIEEKIEAKLDQLATSGSDEYRLGGNQGLVASTSNTP